ncbi:hypothetical protein [Aeromonas schubertii]|uniref:Uncharacterized protein n=1 Tax=Aeromonas schubertii TaxID=652 RepID=A0A0S2SFG1_9GAMM|nr:hypothetical protein [Aeromonas schubertii]ALP40439.1 hypothetical protein WL1483_1020 [Aeromonas schubertii]
MNLFETMENSLNSLDSLISNNANINRYVKEYVNQTLSMFQDGLEIQSSFWFVILNYLTQRAQEGDQEAKELVSVMKRMGIE